jgi:hypothetical protein
LGTRKDICQLRCKEGGRRLSEERIKSRKKNGERRDIWMDGEANGPSREREGRGLTS